VSINSPALANPCLIDALSARFGAQCVVIGIDSQLTPQGYRAWQFSGDSQLSQESGRDVVAWVREVQERGAGEIVLNCMGSDGVRSGYDIEQLRRVREVCRVPLVASGGAGAVEHFRDVFTQASVDAALAASVFHSGSIAISDLSAICMRPVSRSVLRPAPDIGRGARFIRQPAPGIRRPAPFRRRRAGHAHDCR